MTKETSIMAINDMPLLILVVHECDNVENESINIHAKIKESENDKEVELKNETRRDEYKLVIGKKAFSSSFQSFFRGGVKGLRPFGFVFFSAGFNIWKEHIKVSSTLIIAPALSNSPQ